MEVNGAAAMRRSSGSPIHDTQAQYSASWRSSSSASGAAGSLSTTSSSSGAAGRISTASGISGSSTAARKRLSMIDGTGPPPSAVAPYLAGPAVASFVSKRTTQKAELVQYLQAHRGSVRAMLNSGDGTINAAAATQITSDACRYGEGQVPLRSSSDMCDSPCAVVSSAAALGEFFNNCSNSRSTELASPAAAAAAAAAGAVSPSSARRASVSAYLQGQQDLAATVSAGVPYLDSTGSSPRAARASDAAAAATTVGSSAGPAKLASNSRHTVVKEALNARLSDAAARASYQGSGGSSPRMHDEVSGIRQSLLAEGRARRASTTAVAGSSGSSPAKQAAAMIARRLSNTTIYPGAYDAAAALGSSTTGAGLDSYSYNSGYDSLQQSWEAKHLASLSKDEQGRVKVGYYGSFAAAPGSSSTLNTMPLAGAELAGSFAGKQQGGLAALARGGGGGGGVSDGGCGSRRSSGSSSSRCSSDGSEGDSDSSNDEDDAADVYGWNPAAAARQKPRVNSKRGGWRTNERMAAKARASFSSSGGGEGRTSGGVGRMTGMNGRAVRRLLLQQPHTTRAVSKPGRQAATSLGKAAAARRSSIGISRQFLLHAPSRQQAAGRVRQRYGGATDGSSGGSSRRSSCSSSDAKTDIFELTVRCRSSITTGKGFLGSLPSKARASNTSERSSNGSDSDSDTGSDNSSSRPTRRTSMPLRCRSSGAATGAGAAAAAAGRKKSQVIRRRLLLRLRNARSSDCGSSSNRGSTSDGEAGAGRRRLVKQRSSIKYGGARYSRTSSMKRLSSGHAAAAAAAGRRSSVTAAAAAASRASAFGIGTHMRHSARISDAARLRAAASSSGGSTGSSSSGGRRLSNALEVFLNPDDKPSHRLSCSAGNAAAVVMGAAASGNSSNDEVGPGWQSNSSDGDDGAAAAAASCRKGRGGQAMQQQQQQGYGDDEGRPGLRKTWSKVYRAAARSSLVAAPHASVRPQRMRSTGRVSGSAAGAGRSTTSLRRGSVAAAQQHAARRSSSGGLEFGTVGRGSGVGRRSVPPTVGGDAGREATWVASVVRRLSGVAPGGM